MAAQRGIKGEQALQPDIGKLLVESYRNLKIILQRARAPKPTAVP